MQSRIPPSLPMKKILEHPLLDAVFLGVLILLAFGCGPVPILPPEVSAPDDDAISATKATLGGTVDDEGTGTVAKLGVVLAPTEFNSDPFIGGDGTRAWEIDGTGTGPFAFVVPELEPGVEYTFRAYATSDDGTGYSADTGNFTTLDFEVTDPTSSNVTPTSATLGGTVESDADGAMSERGVVYSPANVNAEPAIGGTGVTRVPAAGTGLGAFTVNATTGIAAGVEYAFKAYARIEATDETVYSDVAYFPEMTGDTYLGVDGPSVSGIAALPDGKVLLGGDFTEVEWEPRSDLVRLNADGTVDSSFTASSADFLGGNSWVQTFAVQSDGKVIMGGSFNVLNGAPAHSNLARLNIDGSIDTGFLGRVGYGNIECIAIQHDGKILLGGYLIDIDGNERYMYLGRLNADGSIDTTFNAGPPVYDPAAGPDNTVRSIAVLPSGKILIGGWFQEYDGVGRLGIALLNEDGSLVPGFDPGIQADSFAVQADGMILVGGNFPEGGGTYGLGRIDENGNVDATFSSLLAPGNIVRTDNGIESIVIQADGKILIGGAFTDVEGTPRDRLARLDADGILDPTFDPVFGYNVSGIAQRADGKIVVAGNDFAATPGVPEDLIAILENDPATSAVAKTSTSRVEWARGGSAPEVSRVFFESSTNSGATWTPLGIGTRIAGGWELTGLSLPGSEAIRARGRTVGGQSDGSSGLVEQSTLAPGTGGNTPSLDIPTTNNLLGNSVTLLGEAIDDGGSPVIEHGFFYSRTSDNANPMIGGAGVTKIEDPSLSNPFSRDVSGLVIGTSYSFRAYAKNGVGTGYSPVRKFTTPGAPRIKSPTVTGISDAGATLGGTITSTGAADILERGVVYRISNPDLQADRLATAQDFFQVPEGGTSVGNFAVAITGLDAGTAYDFAAYARNIYGTTYTSPPSTFTTTGGAPAAPEDSPDGGGLTESAPQEAPGDPAGTLDGTHDANVSADDLVQAVAIQPDGKAILAGDFNTVGGAEHLGLARLDAAGVVDPTFTTGVNGLVYSVAVQPDGKVVLGGAFDRVNGNLRNGIARLEADGSVEIPTSFSPGAGADNIVFAVALQPDGKILLGGLFTTIQGVARKGVARLNADGSLDTAFDPGLGADDAVYSVAAQPDGKILIGGAFANVGGTARNRVARLNANGSHDTTFNPGSGANDRIAAVVLQPDGKILLGGFFSTINGTGRNRLARLLGTGALDTTFDPGSGANDHIYTLALQADGKVFAGGLFQTINGTSRNRIARLNANGSVDTTFDPGTGADGEVAAVALQEDGSILAGGAFQSVNGTARKSIARLANDPATQSLTAANGTQVNWLRGGASPEVLPVEFEISLDGGLTWSDLGVGTKVGGGWALTGQILPRTAMVRSRGKTAGGFLGGSSGLVEETLAFDHNATVAGLRTSLNTASAKEATLQRQLKALKKKKRMPKKVKARKTAALNKKIKAAKAATAAVRAQLAKYP